MSRNQGREDLVSTGVLRIAMPVAKPLARFSDFLRDFCIGVVHAPSLEARDRALQAQINALALYQERIDLLSQENQVLRNQLGFGPIPGHERVGLDVVGFSQSDRVVILDGGSERGIQPDMPVVNGEGLVGIVQSVARGWSKVGLITTYNLQVGGVDISRKPPEQGLLKGQGATMLSMTMFDPKAPVSSGDKVVTGGLSQHIPYGLIIGRVISVEADPEMGTPRVTVDPAVNVGLLKEVQVLK